MILLLYAAILMKKQWWNRRTGLAGYLICLLAILWNTETGVILAWHGWHFIFHGVLPGENGGSGV